MSTAKTKALLACGAIGGPAFVIVFLIEGATRINYSPLRQPVSSLSMGDFGWIQIANFITTGCLLLAFAMGLRRALRPSGGSTWGPVLVGLLAIGLIGAGVFIADPLNGYPPGTPMFRRNARSMDIFTISLGFQCFWACPSLASCSVASLPDSVNVDGRSTQLSADSSCLSLSFLPASAFSQNPSLVNVAGVFQRLSITIGWSWMTLLAVHYESRASVRSAH